MKDLSTRPKYRYPGVMPFATEQNHIFFGREKDTASLLKLISRYPLTILYGKSGLGKSSIINAGIIPKLIDEGIYVPLLVRFGAWTEQGSVSPLEITKAILSRDYQQETFLSRLDETDDSLWFRAKNRQLNGDRNPLLIFDQFEELFSYADSHIAIFKQEMQELLFSDLPLRFQRKLEAANVISEEEEDFLEKPLNTRILFTIRSDRLHLLDNLKDYFPSIFQNTFELNSLKEEMAIQAIKLPAGMKGDFATPPFHFTDAAIRKLLDFATDKYSHGVEGVMIQMLCEHYERNHVEKLGIIDFDLDQVGDLNNLVINYYFEKLSHLGANEQLLARKLIEDGLVTEGDGIRLSLHEAFIFHEYKVDKSLLEKLVDIRLLRSEPFLRGGYTYELSHDRLVTAVIDARRHRRKEEAEKELEIKELRLKLMRDQVTRKALGIQAVLFISTVALFLTILLLILSINLLGTIFTLLLAVVGAYYANMIVEEMEKDDILEKESIDNSIGEDKS